MTQDNPTELLRDIHTLFVELWSAPERPRAVRAFDHLTDLAKRGYGRGGGGGGRGPGSHADPVLEAVLDEASREEARRLLSERAEIIDGLKGALMKLQAVEKRVAATLEPNAPINYKPGCSICSTVSADDGRPHFNSYQEVKARGLCGWHYRFQFGDGPSRPGFGVPPTKDINRWHLDHPETDVPKTTMKDQMPEAWADRERRKREGTSETPTTRSSADPTWARPDMEHTRCATTAWIDGIDRRCALPPHNDDIEHVWAPVEQHATEELVPVDSARGGAA